MNQLIRDMALEQGIKPYNIRKWIMRGFVPHRHRLDFLQAADKRGAKLAISDFEFGKKKAKAKPAKRRRATA